MNKLAILTLSTTTAISMSCSKQTHYKKNNIYNALELSMDPSSGHGNGNLNSNSIN